MYLNFNTGILTDDLNSRLETKEYAVFWEDVSFVKGIPSGEESIRRFLEHVSEGGIEKACKLLWGGFTCFMHDKHAARTVISLQVDITSHYRPSSPIHVPPYGGSRQE